VSGRTVGAGPSGAGSSGAQAFEVVGPSVAPRPVVVHVPHAGTAIPEDVRDRLLLDDGELAEELALLTDHHTDELAADVGSLGATRFVNRLSRLVVDPERFPDAAREVMEPRGMGAVYTATSDRRRLRADDAATRQELLDRYFVPYAAAFAQVVSDHLDDHGRCTIVDLHSYPTRRLPYEIGGDERPQVCIGTDPAHTPGWLHEAVVEVAGSHGLEAADDTPFSGVYVPLDRYGVDDRVSAVMLELRRDTYLDERRVAVHEGVVRMRAFVRDVVAAITRH
jgi:N-formylglutamate deformylase